MQIKLLINAFRFSTVLVLASIFAFSAQNLMAAETTSFRTVPIPKREHGYNTFKSQVIRSQTDWETFTKKHVSEESQSWNNKKDFTETIEKEAIDFDTEALVLIRHTEGSGSVTVTFKDPQITDKKVSCTISRKVPEIGTADMAYYCFALVVKKSDVSEVEIKIKDKDTKVIKIAKPAE